MIFNDITDALIQIDGSADFTFDIPDLYELKRRALGIAFYEGYVEEEFVTITARVTEDLTGNQVFNVLFLLLDVGVGQLQWTSCLSTFRPHTQQYSLGVCGKVQI